MLGVGIKLYIGIPIAGKTPESENDDVYFNAKLTEYTTITAGHTVIFNKVNQEISRRTRKPTNCSNCTADQCLCVR